MRRLTAFLALALMALAPAANAQVVLGVVNTGSSSYTTGETRPFQLNADGTLKVGAAANAPVGTAQGSTTSGQTQQLVSGAVTTADPTYTTGTTNPFSLAPNGAVRTLSYGQYNTTLPTLANGGYGVLQTTARNELLVTLNNGTGTTLFSGQMITDANTVTPTTLVVQALGYGYNGTTRDRLRTVQGADGTGLGVPASNPVPVSAATGGLVSVRNTAVGSAQVLKASAGNLYDWQVTSGASAGYVLIFNATSAPADGAVTPAQCVAMAANTTVGSGMAIVPEYFSTGITVVFSTTGCFTKTASATAFIRGRAQ